MHETRLVGRREPRAGTAKHCEDLIDVAARASHPRRLAPSTRSITM